MTSTLAADRAQTAGRRPSLPYRPELDGVRAIAVMLVLLFHAGFGWMSGGYVGVSVFFTLSGFLITRLLIAEYGRSNDVALAHFWMRRARRLLPASLFCLILVFAAAAADLLPTTEHLRRDIRAATFQVFNWVQLSSDQSYAELLTKAPGALDHYWSLAIEEQFYWFWPIIVLAMARRSMLRGGILVLTAVAFVVAPLVAVVFGGDAAYWATPARAGEVLAGAALAVVAQRRPAPSSAIGTSVASIGLFVIVVCAVTWSSASGPAYSGWLPVFAIASVALIWGSASGPINVFLSSRALVMIGGVSYGLYLYHWPVYVVISAERTGWERWPLTFVRLAVTAAIAAASYVLLEQPIRRGRFTDRAVLTGVGVTTAALLLASFTVSAPPARFTVSQSEAITADLPDVVDTAPLVPIVVSPSERTDGTTSPTAAPDDAVAISVPGTATTTVSAVASFGDELVSAAIAAPLRLAEPAPSRPIRVVVTGDSTAWSLGDGLLDWAERHSDQADVRLAVAPGCTFLTGIRLDRDLGDFSPVCERRIGQDLSEMVEQFAPDLVVAMVSVADIEEFEWNAVEGVLVPPDERFAVHMRSDYRAFSDSLIAGGAGGVVFVQGPRPESIYPHPLNDSWRPGRTEMQHSVIADLATLDSDIEALDLNRWYLASDYGATDEGRSDGVHLDEAVAIDVAERLIGPWLVAVALNRAAE